MDTPNKIDTLDEALRVVFLESAKETEVGSTEMEMLLASPVLINMNEERKIMLLEKLNSLVDSFSFGQLLQQAMENSGITEEMLSEKVNLPINVIADLRNDTIYTNNVPIVLFKGLLSTLSLSYRSVETAIRKTFEILQNQVVGRGNTLSGFSPAFRKGYHTSKDLFSIDALSIDGKELFENKEALEKYLNRLNELMKS